MFILLILFEIVNLMMCIYIYGIIEKKLDRVNQTISEIEYIKSDIESCYKLHEMLVSDINTLDGVSTDNTSYIEKLKSVYTDLDTTVGKLDTQVDTCFDKIRYLSKRIEYVKAECEKEKGGGKDAV